MSTRVAGQRAGEQQALLSSGTSCNDLHLITALQRAVREQGYRAPHRHPDRRRQDRSVGAAAAAVPDGKRQGWRVPRERPAGLEPTGVATEAQAAGSIESTTRMSKMDELREAAAKTAAGHGH